MEALSNPTSYPALTGSGKQYVLDAEHLFHPELATFMEKKGYHFEARYIRVVWNWRRAGDECGLSERQRSKSICST